MRLELRTIACICGSLALAAGCHAADDVVEEATARVRGEVAVPADVEGFAGRTLELRLYKIHPLLADAPADLVERVAIEDFGHEAGGDTRQDFEIGGRAPLEADKTYYLTCFVLDGERRTHIGEPPDKGLCKVLTLGHGREARLTIRPVR